MVHSSLIPPSPLHLCRPSLLPTVGLHRIRCPSPLLRDVGPPPWSTDGYGREEQRGDPQSGRPRQCVMRTRQTKVVSRSRCSYLSNITTNMLGLDIRVREQNADSVEGHEGAATVTRAAAKGRTTTRQVNRRLSRQIDDPAGKSTTQRAIDSAAGQPTTQRASGPVDNTATESTTPRTNRRHSRPIDNPVNQTTTPRAIR